MSRMQSEEHSRIAGSDTKGWIRESSKMATLMLSQKNSSLNARSHSDGEAKERGVLMTPSLQESLCGRRTVNMFSSNSRSAVESEYENAPNLMKNETLIPTTHAKLT